LTIARLRSGLLRRKGSFDLRGRHGFRRERARARNNIRGTTGSRGNTDIQIIAIKVLFENIDVSIG
jgi:hypothetical protein